MEYICLNCGRTVETEHGELEDLNCKCGGHLAEAERCCECGKLIANERYIYDIEDEDDKPYVMWSGKYICYECIKKHINFETAYRYLESEKEIIDFWEYYYDADIRISKPSCLECDLKILWNYKKQNDENFFDLVFDYIVDNIEYFANWLEMRKYKEQIK